MSDLNAEIVKAARLHVGSPFTNHFDPNRCKLGRITLDSCMEQGMNASGFDCSGLVIASLCEVMGTRASDWPREYRHLRQLEALAVDVVDEDGDVLLLGPSYGLHCGIVTGEHTLVHASCKTELVEESWAEGIANSVYVLRLTDLVQVVSS